MIKTAFTLSLILFSSLQAQTSFLPLEEKNQTTMSSSIVSQAKDLEQKFSSLEYFFPCVEKQAQEITDQNATINKLFVTCYENAEEKHIQGGHIAYSIGMLYETGSLKEALKEAFPEFFDPTHYSSAEKIAAWKNLQKCNDLYKPIDWNIIESCFKQGLQENNPSSFPLAHLLGLGLLGEKLSDAIQAFESNIFNQEL